MAIQNWHELYPILHSLFQGYPDIIEPRHPLGYLVSINNDYVRSVANRTQAWRWRMSARTTQIAEDSPKLFSNRDKFSHHFHQSISDWMDLDIVGSHYAYGLDYFCTLDRGGSAGSTYLHRDNDFILRKYNVQIVSPAELLDQIRHDSIWSPSNFMSYFWR